jgi:hypothetical protein
MKNLVIILFFLPLSIWAQNSQFLQNYIEFNGTKYYMQNGYFTGRSSKDTICSHDFEEKVFISTPSKIYGCAVYHGYNPCSLPQPPENKYKVCRKCKEVESDSFNRSLNFQQKPNPLLFVDTIKQRIEIDICQHDGVSYQYESNGYYYLYCEKCNLARELSYNRKKYINQPHENNGVYLDLLRHILQIIREDLEKGRTMQIDYYLRLFDKIDKTHFKND